jgi:nicotinate dehydrogenase subunit A
LTQTIELNVNGARRVVTADPGTPLIYILRNDLKLKGTRFGCGSGVCGCCTVLLDGRGIQSCNTPVSAAQGREVTTIEGLGGKAGTHPLQQAFVDEQAGQCGYCLSGILISAAALLARNPRPSRSEIAAALDRHLCRCGVHNRIMRAVARAGASIGALP